MLDKGLSDTLGSPISISGRRSGIGPKIALLGPYGGGNLGDVAIQEAAISNFKRLRPDASIIGIAGNRQNVLDCHGIECFLIAPNGSSSTPTRIPLVGRLLRFLSSLRFTVSAWRLMTTIDLLVVSGGGQIDDYWGGPWGHPFAVLHWTLLAKITGTPVAVASVGFDQLKHPASRMFFRTALRLADYRSFRDRKTLEFVTTDLKVRGEGRWVPDLAFSLPATPNSEIAPKDIAREPLVVGISPISHAAWTRADDPVYEQYLSALRELVDRLRKRGVHIRLFPSQVRMDLMPLQALLSADGAIGPGPDNDIIVNPIESLDDMLREVNSCDIVVAARLHGVLLSVLMHKPVVAVSYSRKVRRLMDELGCPELCLDVDSATPETLNKVLDDAIERRAEISTLERETVAEWKSRIDQQYRDILDLLD